MDEFDPFNKDISSLTAADLAILTEVREGWFVEYKRELPNPTSIAKSISAFANSHGGWLIIGVAESSKIDATAGAFCGVPLTEVDGALNRIRQAVNSHVTPIPEFVVQVVKGEPGTMLSPDTAVICVKVEEGPRPPYLHSRGVIFRRVGEGSEAKSDIDRHELDMLYERRRAAESKYDRWIDRRAAAEFFGEDIANVRLLLDTNRHSKRAIDRNLTASELKDLLCPNPGSGLPLESVYPTGMGWIARQTSTAKTLDSAAFTWIIRGGWREVWWPLSVIEADTFRQVQMQLSGVAGATSFLAELELHNFEQFRVVDLSKSFLILGAIAEANLRLDEALGLTDDLHFRIELSNVRGCVPFFGVENSIDAHRLTGLPIQLTSSVQVPSMDGSEGLMPTVGSFSSTNERALSHTLQMFDTLAFCFGYDFRTSAEASAEGVRGILMKMVANKSRPSDDKFPESID